MPNSHLSNSSPWIFVISGVQASGKSTVAHLLARHFERGVYIEADALQKMIVSGGVWVSNPGLPSDEAANQLKLRLKNMCLLGRSFYEAGFTVVLDDLILGERWQELQAELEGLPFTLIILAPRQEIVLKRDRSREKTTLGEDWASYLDEILRTTMSGVGIWIDSSEQRPEETVDQILALTLKQG